MIRHFSSDSATSYMTSYDRAERDGLGNTLMPQVQVIRTFGREGDADNREEVGPLLKEAGPNAAWNTRF